MTRKVKVSQLSRILFIKAQYLSKVPKYSSKPFFRYGSLSGEVTPEVDKGNLPESNTVKIQFSIISIKTNL